MTRPDPGSARYRQSVTIAGKIVAVARKTIADLELGLRASGIRAPTSLAIVLEEVARLALARAAELRTQGTPK